MISETRRLAAMRVTHFLTGIVLLAIVSSISGVKIQCMYEQMAWGTTNVGIFYTCRGTVISWENPKVVTEITGYHFPGKKNADVTAINIGGSLLLSTVPRGIETFFPYLQVFQWKPTNEVYGNITTVDSSIFKPFPNLLIIAIQYNKLKNLDGNLFQYTRKVKELYLGGNLLEHAGYDLLTGLNDLVYVQIHGNTCINFVANSPQTIKDLKAQLPIKCPPLGITTVMPATKKSIKK